MRLAGSTPSAKASSPDYIDVRQGSRTFRRLGADKARDAEKANRRCSSGGIDRMRNPWRAAGKVEQLNEEEGTCQQRQNTPLIHLRREETQDSHLSTQLHKRRRRRGLQ